MATQATSGGSAGLPSRMDVANDSQLIESMTVVCSSCELSIKASQHLLRCIYCNKSINLTCMLKLFKEAGNEPLRNKIDWLAELLQFGYLAYQCKECKEKHSTLSPKNFATETVTKEDKEILLHRNDMASLQSSIKTISANIDSIILQVNDMQRSLQSTLLSATLPTEVQEEGSPAVIHPSTTSQLPSYASMLTKSLSDTVSKAVEKSIKARDNAARDKLSAKFYHLPEHRQDLSDVTKVLKAMSVKCIPISCIRLGRPTTGNSASRLLKVIFRGTEDKEEVINAAKQLKGHSIFGQVSVSRFLSHEELSKVKNVRNRCRQMNEALTDGTRP